MDINSIFLGIITMQLSVIGYFGNRYIKGVDAKLKHLEEFGCVFCEAEHRDVHQRTREGD